MKDGVREEGKQRRKARGAHKEIREGRRKGKATRGDTLRVSMNQKEDEKRTIMERSMMQEING